MITLPSRSRAVGSCSQALLCCILPMRKDAATQRKERGKIDLTLSVIHINEAAAHGLESQAAAAHSAEVLAAAARCGAVPPAASVHVVPLSDVFLLPEPDAPDGGRGAQGQAHDTESTEQSGAASAAEARDARLRALLQSVPDPTGREDLLTALRVRLLAATAARLGVGKVLRGDSAAALAARVIADTAKVRGRGYALPSDIQLVDARGLALGEPALLYPMREVTLKEAVYMCRLRGLRPAELPQLPAATGARRSINDLANAFIGGLQANLPSTVFTVLRTAAALRPFPFNALDAIAPLAPASSSNASSAARMQATAPRPANETSEPVTAGGGGNETEVRNEGTNRMRVAHASTLAGEAAEREIAIASQKQQLEYLLLQQENARKAALLAQRKAVEQQVVGVETALQQKLTEQRASVMAAEKNGDASKAEVFKAQEAQLEEKAAQVRKAAVQIESRLDRVEMLQKAKAVAEKQQVERAAKEAVDDINVALDRWLESISSLK
ncbi:hypothetical protein GPECTOR_3g293 [Gonium pectorale]|uniref:Uncharacterized protein n=1 Tax=Gonium pectorale TaxID=33097 RepID=A0A150GZF8_GONPE|nr:hypothetical protein GPECTOR_3g293 [Gonium pectorale]|eukprot:KXZ55143.1 hypothetical protein GPECTOR_3g293 [Gonium pectorale]